MLRCDVVLEAKVDATTYAFHILTPSNSTYCRSGVNLSLPPESPRPSSKLDEGVRTPNIDSDGFSRAWGRNYVRYYHTFRSIEYTIYAGEFLLPGRCQNNLTLHETVGLPARLEDGFRRFHDRTPLCLMKPLFKVFQRIFLPDLHRPYQHRLSTINLSDDLVDHHAGVLDLASPKGVEGSLDRVHPIKRTGESRMEVDDRNVLSLNFLQERITQDVHPACQNDEIRRRG